MQAVKKVWGYEYPIFKNSNVEVKYLNINKGDCTSLHCHSLKKTGLCVLSGLVKIDFLNDSFWLEPGDKIMIRPGVFHRSNAKLNSELLEIENPIDVNDLIRLDDKYGRPQGYEQEYINVPIYEFKYNTINFVETLVTHKQLSSINPGKYMILDGGIYNIFNSKKVYVLGPGDLVDSSIITKLSKRFTIEPITVLHIEKTNV